MTLRNRLLAASLFLLGGLLLAATASSRGPQQARAVALPPLPAGWPSTLEVGISDAPGGGAATPLAFRYQYLAGGVNTGSGWANWNSGGQFVTYYIRESSLIPVFTYYMIRHSAPGNTMGESAGIAANLQSASTMSAYYADLKLFFQRAGAAEFAGRKVVMHVEPDMWGYLQQGATTDNATTVAVKVGSSGFAEVAGLPDNASGLARAVIALRNTYAPNVILAYHLSAWGTGNDIVYSDPPAATVDALATRAANFYTSLNAPFDIVFAEFSDRDSGFKQLVYGDGGASWWDAADFSRNVQFLGKFVSLTNKRIVMWQIPQGNTRMLSMNNTWNHYQDNRVEWLFDDPTRTHLSDYVNAGVVAFLFGRGADGATCSCDANGDGVTNPPAINGNTRTSTTPDDDGGFFRERIAAYYAAGAMPLSGGGAAPTATPTNTPVAATSTPVPPANTPAATPTRTSTPTPTPGSAIQAWTTTATVSPATIRRSSKVTVTANVRSNTAASALVDIELYGPTGAKVYQRFWDNRSFSANVSRSFNTSWTPPTSAPTGVYTVRIGVFSVGWGSLFHWNNGAATFTVTQ